MARRIRISAAAENDIANAYIQSALDFGLSQADKYRADIFAAVELLSDFPEIGRRTAHGRSRNVGAHRIEYRVDAEGDVVILRMLHARQLPSDGT